MIKNERQYKITRSQVEKFKETLSKFESTEKISSDVDPRFHKLERSALESQLLDLQREIQEYEDLKGGKIPIMELFTIEDLPTVLIKARIALGLSQKDLAERIGLQEQQIQRYEATDYESASVTRVKEIIGALDSFEGKIKIPSDKIYSKDLFKKMSEIGLNRDFVLKRLLPSSLAARFESSDVTSNLLGLQAAAHVSRIFGWMPDQIFSPEPLVLNTSAISNVRYKVPKLTNQSKLNVYTVYARYVAMLISQATKHLQQKTLDIDPYAIHESIVSTYGSITFKNLVQYVWNLGIPILALDPISFHAACFRDDNRSIIVLTQKTISEARWMFNLMHEFYHAVTGTEQIAEDEDELHNSDEERIASKFADIVLLGKDPDKLTEQCLERANWNIPHFKKMVQKIADEEQIRADVLANHIAHRLKSEQNVDWWGTAQNLQKPLDNAYTIIRNTILEYAKFNLLSDPDLELLKQTLSVDEVIING